MLEKLEAKMLEQEEIRLREKQELEEQLRKETDLIKLAKEQVISTFTIIMKKYLIETRPKYI